MGILRLIYASAHNIDMSSEFAQHEFMMQTLTGDFISFLENDLQLSSQDATALALSGYDDLWADSGDAAYMTATYGISAGNAKTIASSYYLGTSGKVCQ
jgi:hypothetical protein